MREALSRLLAVDADWSSAPVQAHEDGDQDKTRIAAPPQMTPPPRQLGEDRPAPAPQLPGTLEMPTLPLSTIAGVASRSTARRSRSTYTIAAAGGVAAALLVVAAIVTRTHEDRPNPTPTLTSSASSASAITSTNASASLSTAPTASEVIELVPVESLPIAKSSVLDAAPASTTSTERGKPIPPPTAPPPVAAQAAARPLPAPPSAVSPPANGTKAKCEPPCTLDKTGVKRWKLECL